MLETFALTSITELATLLVAVFGAFGGIIIGFYKYAQSRENDFQKARDNQTKVFTDALAKLGEKIEDDSKVTAELVDETKKGRRANEKIGREAEKRNGHLGQQNIEIINISKEISESIQKIPTQNVKKQNVEKQVIEKSEKE